MKPRITVITLGVDDLDASLKFYRDGLNLPPEVIIGREFAHGAVAFFDLQGGLKLPLFERRSIPHDVGIRESRRSPTDFTLGHNLRHLEERRLRHDSVSTCRYR